MEENTASIRRLCWKVFTLLTLVGCIILVTPPSVMQANDPIACQHQCFESFYNCCGYDASCGAGYCSFNYYDCGGRCGNFQGKNCHNRAADFYEGCMANGDVDYGCSPGNPSCCYNAYTDILTGCLYP
jgi:hypothetical protein